MIKLIALLLSGAKLGKLFTSAGSMLLAVLVYSWVFGWRYAVGFVALMFIHEMGHFIAARQKGLPVGLPTFIPFIGAWVELKKMPHDAETEAYVGMGGPLLGTVAATLCYLMARGDASLHWLLAVSYSGFFLNLLNLMPIPTLDGGRITTVLSPKIWWLGLPLLGLVFFYNPSPMLLLVALVAGPHAWQAWRHRRDPAHAAYYAVSPAKRWEWAAYYLLLAAYLAVMAHDVHAMLGAAR